MTEIAALFFTFLFTFAVAMSLGRMALGLFFWSLRGSQPSANRKYGLIVTQSNVALAA